MSDRVAILVIHGMGAQKPYETLDQFARGVERMLPKPAPGGKGVVYTSEIRYRQHDEDPAHQEKAWTQAFVRLTPADPANLNPTPRIIDLVEYYWAPIINGRVSALQSLRFLLLAALSPFDYLRANMLVIDEVSGKPDDAEIKAQNPGHVSPADEIKREGFSNSSVKQALFILMREIYRTIVIFFPMILLVCALYGFLAQPLLSALTKTPQYDWMSYFWVAPSPSWRDAIVLAVLTLRWLLIGMACKYFLDARLHPEAQSPNQKSLIRSCNLAVFGVMAFLIVLPFVVQMHSLAWWTGPPHVGAVADPDTWLSILPPSIRSFLHVDFIFAPLRLRLVHLFIYGLLGLLSYAINQFLTTAVGGLAVYLGSDTLSTNYTARSQILSECTATVEDLLAPHRDLPLADPAQPENPQNIRQYDRVLIAAHSLGTVIAYDVLNDLMTKNLAAPTVAAAAAAPKLGLDRITALFTFGSPLNKIFYFFRSRTEKKTTVLNEILYDLHNFRLRIPAPVGAVPTGSPFSKHFCWYNAWSPWDIVSGRMLFYWANKNQPVKKGIVPWKAHTSYWENDALYTLFSDLL
jgi:hypothetical protein